MKAIFILLAIPPPSSSEEVALYLCGMKNPTVSNKTEKDLLELSLSTIEKNSTNSNFPFVLSQAIVETIDYTLVEQKTKKTPDPSRILFTEEVTGKKFARILTILRLSLEPP